MSKLTPTKHANDYECCIRAAIASVDRRMDCWRWANQERLYMDREELLKSMSAKKRTHIIVDTRDDDAAGGHIYGAMHIPDGSFNEKSILKILTLARQLHTSLTTTETALKHVSSIAAPKQVLVVFHCMESARRGPRCARRFVLAIEALRRANMEVPAVRVAVLKGGFDQWVRRFWKNPMLVQGYDDEYWGYAELEVMRQKRARASIPLSNLPPPIQSGTVNQPVTTALILGTQSNTSALVHANESPDVHRSHSLYSRPADQPATPWSDAGSDIERAIASAVVPGISDGDTSGTIADVTIADASEDVCGTGTDATPHTSVVSGTTATLPR